MKRMYVILALGCCVAAGILFWVLGYFSHLSYAYETGREYRYDFSVKTSSSSLFFTPDGESQENIGAMECDIQVSLFPLREKEGHYVIAVTLDSVGKCSMMFNGENLFADPVKTAELLTGKDAVAVIEKNGLLSDLYFRKNEEPVFMNMMKLILGQVEVVTGTGRSWQVKEMDQYGKYTADYGIRFRGLSDVRIRKNLVSYYSLLPVKEALSKSEQLVEGETKVVFGPGYVKSMDGSESVSVKNAENVAVFSLKNVFSWNLVSIRPTDRKFDFSDATLSHMDNSLPGVVSINAAMQKQLLESRADLMSTGEMSARLKEFSTTGEIPDKERFWWRVSGYLKLHPERCGDMVPLFNDPKATSEARMFMIGILVSVGSPEAQQVIRSLLEGDSAKNDLMYSLMVQNLGHIENPDAQTVELATILYTSAKDIGKNVSSTAYMLGAVSGKLAQSGAEQQAAELYGLLAQDLKAAESDKARETLLESLGNAGNTETIEIARQYISSDNPRLRATVASALRMTQTPESEKMMLELSRDFSTMVQRQAIQMLGHYNLSPDQLEVVAKEVQSGGIKPNSYFDVLQLLSKYPEQRDVIRETLEFMKKRPLNDPNLEGRINNMLRSLNSR